jgi:uncharacterized protein YjbI with pentapeptide repeats
MGRLLRHSIALAFLLLLTLVPGIAAACSCRQPEPPEMLRGADVILDGYVQKIEPAETEGRLIATIRVLRAWKGDLPDVVTLEYARFDRCSAFGNLKAHTSLMLFAYGDPRLRPLGIGLCDIPYSRPGPELEALVHDYAARQLVLRDAADGGTTGDKIKFAEFLLSNSDEPQARDVLLPILNEEPEIFRRWVVDEGGHEALVWPRHKWRNKRVTPPTAPPSADGKMARAVFTLTGTPDLAWKDWSNLEPIGGECRFENASLAGVSFAGSVLPACSFRHSKFSDADFSNAQLSNASFEGATLSTVDFNGAYLSRVKLDGASVVDMDMRDVSGLGISFSQGSMRNVELSGLLSGDFAKASLQNVTTWNLNGQLDLSLATLRDVEFRNSSIKAIIKGARLINVRFDGGRLDSLRAEDTDLTNTEFANITEMAIYINCGTVLPSMLAETRGLIPVERNCPALQSSRDFRSVMWHYQDLSGLDFSNSDFTGASLTGVKLIGTNLSNSNLSRVDLNYATLSGANLDAARLDGATNLGWFAERKKGVNRNLDAPPASLRGTTFGGTTVSITALVGIVGHAASIDLDTPNFDNVTIACDRLPLERYLEHSLRNDATAAAQDMLESQAIKRIRAKWPTTKLTDYCSILQGSPTSATP